MLAVPVTPLVHGAQSGTTTGPGVPLAAIWMCAATAGPVSPVNDSCQVKTAPVSDFVSVPVNVPFADPTSPFGAGVSSEAAIAAEIFTCPAWPRAPAPPATTSATAAPRATTEKTSFDTTFPLCDLPLCDLGSQVDPFIGRLRATSASGLCGSGSLGRGTPRGASKADAPGSP